MIVLIKLVEAVYYKLDLETMLYYRGEATPAEAIKSKMPINNLRNVPDLKRTDGWLAHANLIDPTTNTTYKFHHYMQQFYPELYL